MTWASLKFFSRYEWYSAAGLVLAWSPIAGKVGVMRLKQNTGKEPNDQIEFSFYIGGKHKHYGLARAAALIR